MSADTLAARAKANPGPPKLHLLLQRLGQATCRHTYMLTPLKDRLILRCSSCGRETCGFTIGERPETRR